MVHSKQNATRLCRCVEQSMISTDGTFTGVVSRARPSKFSTAIALKRAEAAKKARAEGEAIDSGDEAPALDLQDTIKTHVQSVNAEALTSNKTIRTGSLQIAQDLLRL